LLKSPDPRIGIIVSASHGQQHVTLQIQAPKGLSGGGGRELVILIQALADIQPGLHDTGSDDVRLPLQSLEKLQKTSRSFCSPGSSIDVFDPEIVRIAHPGETTPAKIAYRFLFH
jgi:hypothetical protein